MKVLKKKRRKTGKKSIAQPEPIQTNISILSYKNFVVNVHEKKKTQEKKYIRE